MSDSECDVEEEYSSLISTNQLNSSKKFHNKLSLTERNGEKSKYFSLNIKESFLSSRLNNIEG